jgi:alginate O-acetyltransferase complex protein AlgJ
MTPNAGTATSLISRRGFAGGALAAALSGSGAAAEGFSPVVVGTDGWLFPIFDSLQYVDASLIKTLAAMMDTAAALLQRAQIQTLIAMTPAKSRVYREFLPANRKISPSVNTRYRSTLAELRRSGVVVPDLAAIMVGANQPSKADTLFLKLDTHWTPAGAALAASEVAKEIMAKCHLPPSKAPGAKLGPPVLRSESGGDLLALLPAAEKAKYPPDTYHIRNVIEDPSSSLLDDETADVAVVGNSYMNPKWNFGPELSNALGRPVTLVWKVHSEGPYATLLSYLNGGLFKKQRPKVLVWNMHEVDLQTAPSDAGVWGENAMARDAFLTNLQRALGV